MAREKRRAAIVTDTVSSQFYFPLWHKYYAEQVGAENIYLLLCGGAIAEFASYQLGGIWRSASYNNQVRATMISRACDMLLTEYEYVVRVDTDEFLVPDPRRYDSLRDYLEKLRLPYVTAFGYNVVASLDAEQLHFSKPIFKDQRGYCYPYDALCKTSVIGVPTIWSPGFHFASVYPKFEDLYLFHMKYADIDMQIAIGEAVAAQSDEALFQQYHRTARSAIESTIRAILSFPQERGWNHFDRPDYRSRFLNTMHFVTRWGGIYHGKPLGPERVLLEVPDEFASML